MTENEELRVEIARLKRDNDVLRETYFREPTCRPAGPCWWVRLDEYEIANLRAAIEAVGYDGTHYNSASNPLSVFNNGDWIGQIYNKLPVVQQRPNRTPDAMREEAKKRI